MVCHRPGETRVALAACNRVRPAPRLGPLCAAGSPSSTPPAAAPQCWRYERTTRGRRREHYQWNMDIIGVPGVEARRQHSPSLASALRHSLMAPGLPLAHAPPRGVESRAPPPSSARSQAEAELLAAIVAFFRSVGLASSDVGIRVSNRKVLQAVLERFEVPPEKFAPVCVVVDKIEKLPRDAVEKELLELGVQPAVVDGLLQAMAIRSLDELAKLLGAESQAVKELVALFDLAKGARASALGLAGGRAGGFAAPAGGRTASRRDERRSEGSASAPESPLISAPNPPRPAQRTGTTTGCPLTRPLSAASRITRGPCSKRSTARRRSGERRSSRRHTAPRPTLQL